MRCWSLNVSVKCNIFKQGLEVTINFVGHLLRIKTYIMHCNNFLDMCALKTYNLAIRTVTGQI